MNDELLDLTDIATMYRCSKRHARDSITKLVGFPEKAPGSTRSQSVWLRTEVRAFLHRKAAKIPRKSPATVSVAMA